MDCVQSGRYFSVERLLPAAHYFIFSDQPEAAWARIPLPDARATLVALNRGDEQANAVLWLMTLCQGFIIANSTFSFFWGGRGWRPSKQAGDCAGVCNAAVQDVVGI